MTYVVGHRGAAGVHPENTIRGFRYAIDLGLDYVECDVHLTCDHHIAVMHDATISRTTNGVGAIRDLTLDTIRQLDAGEGEQVPTLDEVLDVVKGKVRLLCELKGEDVEQAAIDAVCARGMENDVTFTSFQIERIEKVKRINSNLRIGAILPNPTEDDIKHASDIGGLGVGVRFQNVCYRVVEQAHNCSLEIRAWNPDISKEQQTMIALGVDGVCTNRPDILMAYLKEHNLRP